MNRFISKVYDWILLAPAVLPLFFVEGMMYPLLAPKTLALRAFGVVAIALFSYLAFSGKSFFWKRLHQWESWIPGALLALAYIASFFGVDFYHSFWSTLERGDGLLSLTVCVGYFYLILISADEMWFRRISRVVAWVGALAAGYLILQWIAVSSGMHIPLVVKPNGRIGGTMGNAAFLAAYLGMTFFAALIAAPGYGGWKRKMLYAGAGLQVFAIFLTATRGTILALVAVAVAGAAYGATREGKWRRKAIIGLGLFVAAAGLFFVFRTELSQSPIEPIRRIASISFSDSTVSSRLFLWKSLSAEALKRPVLGYGAENISAPFDRVYDPTQIAEEWFDRSHDAYLDYLVQFGIGGLVFYVALVALLFREGWLLRRENHTHGLFVMGLVGVYAIQNIFVFDTTMTLWLFFAIFAVLLARRASGAAELCVLAPKPFYGAIAGLALVLLIIPVSINPLRANLLAFEVYQYQIVDVPRANAAAERGIALDTYADREFGYNAYFMYTEEQVARLSGDDLRLAYQNAAALLTRAFKRYPSDARTAVYLAQVLASAPEGVKPDEELFAAAVDRSIRLSPKRVQAWYIIANLAISEANKYPVGSKERTAGYASARDILSKYIALVPGLAEPHFILAQLYYASDKPDEAAKEAALGKSAYVGGVTAARRAVAYYGATQDLPNLEFFLADIVRMTPVDYASAYDLAKVKFLLGDVATAKAMVTNLQEIAPEVVDSDPAFKAAIAQ